MRRTRTRGAATLAALAAALAVVVAGFEVELTGRAEAAPSNCKTLWVSLDGDDAAAGTERAPFATLEAARDAIREKNLNRNMKCDVTVNVTAGDYPVTSTFELDDRDSGSNGHRVVYRSVDGPGAAKLVGAEEITGWEPHENGIYKAKVDVDSPFFTLFVDGSRATVARHPNRASSDTWAPYLVSRLIEPEKEAIRDQIGYNPGEWDESADLGSYTSWPAQVTIWSGGSWSWFTDVVPIKNADTKDTDNKLILDYWTRYAMVNSRSGSRYFLQNSLDFLDQQGEYYLDYEAQEVYYKPAGESMDGLRVMRPTVTKVIDIKGASPERRVEDVTFDGLSIQYSDFMEWYRNGWISAGDSGEVHKYPEYDRQIEMPRHRYGTITLENTSGITFTGLRLSDTGYHGLYALFANDHLTVENSLLENMGADAIKVEGGYPGEGDLAHSNAFRNLYIDHIGELVPGDSAGIELMGTGDNLIEHVHVKHSARYGISLESRPEVVDGEQYADGNTFRYIRIDRAGLDSGDMGAFYTYGVDNQDPHPVQNTVDQMVIGDVLPDASMPDSGTRGVHMDAGGCGFRFSNIVVGKTTDQSYQSYQCNEVSNSNWQADFDDSQIEYDKIGITEDFPYEIPAS